MKKKILVTGGAGFIGGNFVHYMVNKYPEYRTMITDSEGHIWSLPWIEQLGSGKKAIQTVGNMSFINQKWLDFLNLEIPETVEEFEEILIAFRDNAEALQKEFNIDGDIIPMSCIINDGDQDPSILINGFGEGYGDPDKSRHIAVTDNLEVISTTVQEGYKEGIQWLHSLYEQGLIDAEAFTRLHMSQKGNQDVMELLLVGILQTLIILMIGFHYQF